MANVANLSIVRSEPAGAAIEVAGLSHIYPGREGAVPALTDIAMTVNAGRFAHEAQVRHALTRCSR